MEDRSVPLSAPSPGSVVVLHGLWMSDYGTWLLRHRLASRGFVPWSFSYASMHGRLDEILANLSATIASLPAPVHLVGHSLGGLVILKLFERFPDQPEGRVVLLGTPACGSCAASAVARWPIGPSLLGPIAVEQLVNAPPRRWDSGRALGVVAGTLSAGMGRVFADVPEPNDGTVAVEETRLEGATDHLALHVSHTGMVLSSDVADQVAHFLQHGCFDRTS